MSSNEVLGLRVWQVFLCLPLVVVFIAWPAYFLLPKQVSDQIGAVAAVVVPSLEKMTKAPTLAIDGNSSIFEYCKRKLPICRVESRVVELYGSTARWLFTCMWISVAVSLILAIFAPSNAISKYANSELFWSDPIGPLILLVMNLMVAYAFHFPPLISSRQMNSIIFDGASSAYADQPNPFFILGYAFILCALPHLVLILRSTWRGIVLRWLILLRKS